MKLGQAMYEAQQAESAEADADGEDVVDADFEEINDDDERKSA